MPWRRHLGLADEFGSTECLQTPNWWLCLLGVSTNYLMHGFIWNYPKRFAALCDQAPLKVMGSHPVDVFASLEVVAKLLQGGSLLAFLGHSAGTETPHVRGSAGRTAAWDAMLKSPGWCWATCGALVAAGQALNVATYNAIGNAGVYYGFKWLEVCQRHHVLGVEGGCSGV